MDEDDRNNSLRADDKALSDLIRGHATRHRASPVLGASLRAELALQDAASRRAAPPPRGRWPAWALAGLGFACGVALTSAALLLGPATTGAGTENQVVASHVRALMADHLTDIASTDQHQVKPWFQGKLDYSPPVRDFTADGYPLVGGRLDYLDGRPVAALIYRHRGHLINVFVWPAPGEQALQQGQRQGYNVLSWRQAGMQYWAVSDLNSAELGALPVLMR